ncbi:hypothetical protein [Salipaludibacillus aurantiacus]|uniref:DUF5673 domain-containing protein n=1 Tax=Salipaludibacillus aurantiacus TaxID=1601833 RepID=A0A1H9T8B0_9BACI|nr:hypothetical protein [Salipaludibacillus aurantiacus]SER93500.1 hypothetical protein SAMN05518684_105179 [Salipaludibacillus aurantiacus]
MQWIYLLTGTIMGVISVYHLFTHKHRKSTQDYVIYRLNDRKKIPTDSKAYKRSIMAAYGVLFLSVFLFVEIFNNFFNATILFFIIFILGTYVLVTLDRIFEIQGEALIFAGYHARWGKIRSVQWGKKKKNKSQLIMELGKGQKIKTYIRNDEADELENVLSNYVYFEK